jgi:hypothetical protein
MSECPFDLPSRRDIGPLVEVGIISDEQIIKKAPLQFAPIWGMNRFSPSS